ncbi:Endoglucanase [Asimina triloba]
MMWKCGSIVVLLLQALFCLLPLASAGHDYGQALSKSILFYEAQRSGYLPSNQRVKWRADSGLHDGKASGIDLVGGYYDAGDNVKFGLPMAFTVTMMSWSIIEYGRQMAATGELGHAMEAVKWGTDYFIKAHPEPNVLYGEVGDGSSDHYCWQRPEDMTTDRHAYRIDANNPGSDLAGETAAAMAAASIVFHRSNPAYSSELLSHAKQVLIFSLFRKVRRSTFQLFRVGRNRNCAASPVRLLPTCPQPAVHARRKVSTFPRLVEVEIWAIQIWVSLKRGQIRPSGPKLFPVLLDLVCAVMGIWNLTRLTVSLINVVVSTKIAARITRDERCGYDFRALGAIHLSHAALFEFADKYRGKYDGSITVARKYYASFSGYADELLWAAAWLYQATNDQYYLSYLGNNGNSLGGTGWAIREFGWDVKYAGVQVLVSKFLMQGKAAHYASVFEQYQQKAEYFMCSCLGKGSQNVQRTPGGLLFRQRWNNMQFVTSASFLLTVYSDYLTSARRGMRCSAGSVGAPELLSFAKSQVQITPHFQFLTASKEIRVDYLLGDNPRATSYMVGYGSNFPQQVHHRGSSIVSYKVDSSFVSCRGGYNKWFSRKASDPNLLMGAVVGGPDAYDNFGDERDNYEQTEPATYNNAPLIGILARLSGGHGGFSQLLPVEVPTHAPVEHKPTPVPQPKPTAPVPVTKGFSPIDITQKATASWNAEGRTYYRYSTVVTNKSTKTARDLKLSIAKLYGPLWGLTGTGSVYGFPKWLDSLPAGKSLEFVYIHSASPADVSVSSFTLA